MREQVNLLQLPAATECNRYMRKLLPASADFFICRIVYMQLSGAFFHASVLQCKFSQSVGNQNSRRTCKTLSQNYSTTFKLYLSDVIMIVICHKMLVYPGHQEFCEISHMVNCCSKKLFSVTSA